MKTHTVPIITNGPLCGEACPWLGTAFCRMFDRSIVFERQNPDDAFYQAVRCDPCVYVTERAEALP